MKSFNILVVFFMILSTYAQEKNQAVEEAKEGVTLNYTAIGEKISPENPLEGKKIVQVYDNLKLADTLNTKFKAEVTEVCQAKGCWMRLRLQDGQEAMVRFKDYGFFMPTDLAGKKVILNGLAFVEEMSVEDQQHYAKDAGKSEEEIASIKEVKKTFGFEADGVLIIRQD